MSLAMNRATLLLACLACMGQGRTLFSGESSKSLEALATLLLELKPHAAFNPSGPGAHRLVRQPSSTAARLPNLGRKIRMEKVDEFTIDRVIKAVSVFDGDYAADIAYAVEVEGKECIANKGSFSLAIPGGSVVVALKKLNPKAFDYSKMHVFFVNEKIPSYPCYEGAQEVLKEFGVPDENIHMVPRESTPAESAEKYTALLKTHESIDNTQTIPSFDMMLLGTGPDGHVGCIFPDSPEVKATGQGQVMMAGNDERADGDFVALSMDVMCSTKVVLISAAAESRAPMVAKALNGDFDDFDCPAAMVEAQEDTLWFVDLESSKSVNVLNEGEEEDDVVEGREIE